LKLKNIKIILTQVLVTLLDKSKINGDYFSDWKKKVHGLQKQLHLAKIKNKRVVESKNELKDLIQELKSKRFFSDSGEEWLESVCSGMPKDLFQRMRDKSRRGKLYRQKYSDQIKKFALTLQFYSTKAYEYVRRSFNLALPHVSVIRSWYGSIDGSPGFTTEAFEALKCRVKELKTISREPLCSLMMDEMSIRKQIEFDGKSYFGFVDLGIGEPDDSTQAATEALVLMVVSLNNNWKCPIGYFLTNGLSGKDKANIVSIALSKLDDIGVKVVSLTCDGPASNMAMFRHLGVTLDPASLQPFFQHPSNSTKVAAILDICHMIKLVRNALASYHVFINQRGDKICWRYIEELHKIQEDEGFRAGNKLKKAHIQWDSAKMKVNLAMQTLSDSVADAIEWCNTDLQLKQFQDSEATCEFIRVFNVLTDIFNSRNPLAKFQKAPMSCNNYSFWRPLLESGYQYISHLKDLNGTLLTSGHRRTAFVGFLLGIRSFIHLFDSLVEGGYLKYLLLYKFSQDHLELFFGAVRSGNPE